MKPTRYSIWEEHQVAFTLLHFRGSIPVFLFAGGLTALVLGSLAYAFDGAQAALSVGIGGLIGVGIVFAFVRYVSVPRFAKRSWRDFALIKEPIDLTIHETGFAMAQPSAHVEGQWDQMVMWDEDDTVFAVYVTRQQAYILPKDQIEPDQINKVRRGLIESGLTMKRKKRK